MSTPENRKPSTPEEAIWDIHARVVSMETTMRGTPNTSERGLVGQVQEVKALAVEVKNYYIDIQGRLSAQEAKCKERTAAGDCVPIPPAGVTRGDVAKVGGASGALGIVIGAALEWLFRHFGGN